MKPFRLWIYRCFTLCLPETRCFRCKAFLLRWAGAKIGRNVRINSSAIFSGNGALEIGDNVWVGAGDFICPIGQSRIIIGDNVDIGPQVMLLTGSHEVDPLGLHIGGKGGSASVKVGAGCWLCARTIILPGVELAEKTVVGAGAVVTTSVTTPASLVAGVPATTRKKYG